MNQLQRVAQQVIDSNKPAAAAEAASNIDGPCRSLRDWQIQKFELGNDVVLWRNLRTRRHWFIRGRISSSTRESVADLQAMLGDLPEVTPEVAQQLGSLGRFEILGFHPRMDGCFKGNGCARSGPVRFVAAGIGDNPEPGLEIYCGGESAVPRPYIQTGNLLR